MVVLPWAIRSTIDELLDEVASEAKVVAMGLIGSWARGDASDSSDFDLMVVERSGVDYEFNEIFELEGLLIDLNRVPWSWVGAPVSPTVDHRLYEAIVLRDPDKVLKWAIDFVKRNYRTPGRIDVRTDDNLVIAEMYLSRASAAATRGDLETASLFANHCWLPVAFVLMDIAGVPSKRRDPVWGFHRACGKLGTREVYDWFISRSTVACLDDSGVRESLRLFMDVWERISESMVEKDEMMSQLHDRLRKEVEYLNNGLIRQRVLGRVEEMLEGSHFVGASIYMRGWLLRLLEGYAWVISIGVGEKYDYTSLFRVLSKHETGYIYNGALKIFGLERLREGDVLEEIDRARSVVSNVRLDRRRLIEGVMSVR